MKSKIYRVPEPNLPLEISGKGNKGLLLVINQADKQVHENTLNGLVKAIQYDINEDVTIISCRDQEIKINTILSEKAYSVVILIGISPQQVGFNIRASKYFIYKMEHFSLLLTDSLEAMNADKSKKMAFWQILQQLFLGKS